MIYFKMSLEFNLTAVLIFTYLILPVCITQDCRMFGATCSDHGMCCGGCCIEGYCVFTTRSCTLVIHLCMERYCPPGFECYLYKPPDCLGCEVVTNCRPFN
ncbi:uncharacterized protein LOC142321105 [Lycorma delicatula]|uniref:uncharacterized protein LOC142321105 n=1 Tax=Lycorma delicatula TaxID=130591 RepID=UPI003F516237